MIEEQDFQLLFNKILEEESSKNKIEKSQDHIKKEDHIDLVEDIFSAKELSHEKLEQAFDNVTSVLPEIKIETKWTILSFSHKDKGDNKLYNCQCACGNIHQVRLSRIKNGKSKQCKKCALEQVKMNTDFFINKEKDNEKRKNKKLRG